MIWDALVNVLFAVVSWLLDLLPNYDPEELSDIGGAVGILVSGIRLFSFWINFPALFGVLALWVTVEVAIGTTQVVQWVYDKIPGKAT